MCLCICKACWISSTLLNLQHFNSNLILWKRKFQRWDVASNYCVAMTENTNAVPCLWKMAIMGELCFNQLTRYTAFRLWNPELPLKPPVWFLGPGLRSRSLYQWSPWIWKSGHFDQKVFEISGSSQQSQLTLILHVVNLKVEERITNKTVLLQLWVEPFIKEFRVYLQSNKQDKMPQLDIVLHL